MIAQARLRLTEQARTVEWVTFGLIVFCHAGWAGAAIWLYPAAPGLAIAVLGVLAALHSSLTHEALHGHPFRSARVNEALMALPMTVFVPYGRFRDLHLAHHRDSRLTDPYDDPESNYLDPAVWQRLPGWRRVLLRVNNTLVGRIVLGPVLGTIGFVASELALIRSGDKAVRRDWLRHLAGLAVLVALVLGLTDLPLWALVLSAYIGLGLLKIRTFLEHRAHERSPGRTVIIEDRGPLALLFLNNNLHAVHHTHPNVAWYRLPALYRANRDRYVARNEGYVYRSYAQVFRAHFLRAKDPVPHPLWRGR